jgi:tetratricopeptide (TPR) repeat protein
MNAVLYCCHLYCRLFCHLCCRYTALPAAVPPAASSPMHVDFLFVVCSPNLRPLPQTSIEARENAACVERAGLTALVHSNGNLTELNTIILDRQPRVIVFAGHADASHPSSKRTLGLTDASGKVIIMEPDTIAQIFSQPSERLELVSLNGCCSSELCEFVTRRYSLPTCGWSSRTADSAAKVHSLGLVDALVQRMKARPAAGRLTSGDLHAAFQHAERSVLAVASGGTSKWALVDPDGCVGGVTRDGQWAAGKPVLLYHRRFPTLADGESPPPLPSEVRGHSAFTGRRVELDELFDTFFPIQRILPNAPVEAARMVLQAIRGMGGVGKTELAVQYAVRYGDWYPQGVYFVSADGAATEESLVRRMATSIGLPSDASADRAAVHRWFAKHKGWLLICDNADDVDAIGPSGALTLALPPLNAPGHVLLTSRIGTEDFGSLGIKSPLTLGLLELSAAEQLLLSVATGLDEVAATEHLATLDSAERAAVAWLAGDEGLARLPLAIIQAGSAIKELKYSFADYRLKFEQRRIALLFKAGTQREEQSVLTTWGISIEALRRKSPAAAELLALCAPLAPDDIPIEMFRNISPVDRVDRVVDEGEGWGALRAQLQAAADDDERRHVIRQQVCAARKYSLIEWNSAKKTVSMHRLVKEVQWRQLHTAEKLSTVLLMGGLLKAAIPKLNESSPLSEANRAGRMLPHVAALLKSAAESAAESAEPEARSGLIPLALLSAARRAHHRRGEWAAQLMMAEAALCEQLTWGKWNEEHGKWKEEHPLTLGLKNNLANALKSAGRPDEAVEMLRAMLEAIRLVQGKEHDPVRRMPAITLFLENNLANALYGAGRHVEAAEMHRTTLEAMLKHPFVGEKHPDTLSSMNNRANALARAGRYDDAVEMYRKTLKARRRVLGGRHPLTLALKNNLAYALYGAGLYDKAEEMHHKTLEARRDVLGEEHPATLRSMNGLACALESAGQHAKAAEMHEARRRVLGEEHPHTLDLMSADCFEDVDVDVLEDVDEDTYEDWYENWLYDPDEDVGKDDRDADFLDSDVDG